MTLTIDLNGSGVGNGGVNENRDFFEATDQATGIFVAPDAEVTNTGGSVFSSATVAVIGAETGGTVYIDPVSVPVEVTIAALDALGIPVAGTEGANLHITYNGTDESVSAAVMQLVFRAIEYRNVSDDPTAGQQDILFVGNEDAGMGETDFGSATSSVFVTVDNDAPVLTANAGDNDVVEAGLDETDDTTVIGDPDASGSFTVDDPDNDPADLVWSIIPGNTAGEEPAVRVGAFGTFTLNDDGTWTYMLLQSAANSLDSDESALDQFSVQVSDGVGGTDSFNVVINVQGSNDGPVAVVDPTTFVALGDGGNVQVVDEDETAALMIDVLANDTDVDGDDSPANFTLVSVDSNTASGLSVMSVAGGSFAINGNMLEFTPGSEFNELADGETAVLTVAYTMSDDSGATASSTASITVTGSNDAPVVAAITATPTNEDADPVSIDLLNGQDDPDTSDELVVSNVVVTSDLVPARTFAEGVDYTVADGVLTFTADLFNDLAVSATETVSVAYDISDGDVTLPNTATLAVSGVNDAPEAQDDVESETLIEDTGPASATGNVITNVAPDAGGDDFDIDSMGLVVSQIAYGEGAAQPVNGTPVAIAGMYGTLTIEGDGSYSYALENNDAETDALRDGEEVDDVFTYTLSDGDLSDTATLTINITGTNDAPTVEAELTGADDDQGMQMFDLLSGAGDVDTGDTLTVTGLVATSDNAGRDLTGYSFDLSGPGNGTLTFDAEQFDDLRTGVVEVITLSYDIEDDFGGSVAQTLSITLTGTNQAPVVTAAPGATGGVTENGNGTDGVYTATGDIDFSDAELGDIHAVNAAADGGGLGFIGTLLAGISDPATADGVGRVTWTFNVSNATQKARIEALGEGDTITQDYTITINDGQGGTVEQDVTITITGTNDQPVIEGTSTLSDALSELDSTTASHTNLSATGTIVFSDIDSLVFANPNTQALVTGVADEHTVDTLAPTATYTPNGGAAEAFGGTIPGALSFAAVDQANNTVDWTYDVADSDVDFLAEGDVLTITYLASVTDDSATATAESATAPITVTITGSNDVPTITAAEVNPFALIEDGVNTLPFGPEAFGLEGPELEGPPMFGASVFGNVSADGNWVDVDTGEQADLAVTQGSFDGDAQVALTFDGSGVGAFAGEATIQGTYGALYITADGSYRYVLDNEDADTDALDNEATGVTETFNYTIANRDGGAANEAISTITVSIEGSNDAPVISFVEGNETGTIVEAGVDSENAPFAGTPSATGTLIASDVDSSDDATNDTWSVIADGAQSQTDPVTVVGTFGTLSVNQNGVWTYTLDNMDADTIALDGGDTVSETFTIGLSDNDATDEGTTTQDVTINITGTNDAPVLTVVAGADSAVTEAGLDTDNTTAIGDAAASGSFTVADDDAEDTTANDLWSIVEVNGLAVEMPGVANGMPSAETGLYGTLSVDSSGAWSYALDDTTGSAADALNAGDSDTETFVVRVADGNGGYDEETVTVTVTGTNDAPVAVVDATNFVALGDAGNVQVVDEDGPTLSIDVLANDTDVDSGDSPANFSLDSLGANSVTGLIVHTISSGSFVINGTALEFTPGAEFDELAPGDTAVVMIEYTMSDDSGASATSSATITVTGSNDAPVIEVLDAAFDDSGILAETNDALVTTGRVVFSDVDSGDTPEASVNTASATIVATGITLSPAQEAAFADAFSITDPATGEWQYSLAAVDSQFLAVGDQVVITFPVTVTDDFAGTATHNVTITIDGTNDAPVAVADTNGVDEVIEAGIVVAGDASATGNVLDNDTDVDTDDTATVVGVATGDTSTDLDDAGTVGVAIAGTYGSLNVDANGVYTYTLDDTAGGAADTLDQDEAAQDVFTYTMVDSQNVASSTTLTIDITGSNDAPVAVADTGTTDDDNPVTVDVLANDTDVDGDDVPATFTLVSANIDATAGLVGSPAVGGSVSVVENELVFDPGLDFEELDTGESATVTITYTMQDSNGAQSTATATVTVDGTNDAPFIVDVTGLAATVTEQPEPESAAVVHGVNETITFNDFEINDTHSVTVVPDVAGGTVEFDGATVAHPLGSYYGIFAGGLASPATGSTDAGEIQWSFSVDDADIDHLAAGEVVTQNYLVTIVDNGAGNLSATETIKVTITGTNDAPVVTTAAPATIELDEATGQTGVATPPLTASGSLAFDDVDASDVGHFATTSVALSGVAGTYGALDDAALLGFLTVTDTDALEEGVQVTKVSGATTGSADWNFSAPDNAFDYLGDDDVATLTYTITINDGDGGTSDHEITIDVTGTNDAPVLGAITSATITDTAASDSFADVTGTLTHMDVDNGAAHTYSATGQVVSSEGGFSHEVDNAFGTLFLNEDTGDYKFVADDSAINALTASQDITFDLVVTDENEASDTETLTITLAGANDDPVLGAIAAGTITDTADDDTYADVTGTFAVSDIDTGSSATYSVAGQTADMSEAGFTHSVSNGLGTLYLNETSGAYTFIADDAAVEALSADDTITFDVTVTDDASATDTGTLTINVAAVNDNPRGTPDAALTAGTEDTEYTVSEADLLSGFSDPENDDLSVSAITADNGAAVVADGMGGFTVTPVADVNGPLTLTYTVADGNGGEITGQTQTFHVNATADPDTITGNGTLDASVTDQGPITPDNPTIGDWVIGSGIPVTGWAVASDDVDAPNLEIGLNATQRLSGGTFIDPNDPTGQTYVVPTGEADGTPQADTISGNADDDYARWNFQISIATDANGGTGGAIGDFDFTFTIVDTSGETPEELASFTSAQFAMALEARTPGAGAAFLASPDFNVSWNLAMNFLGFDDFDANAPGSYRIAVTADDPTSGTEVLANHIDIVVNEAPVAVDDTLDATEDTEITYTAAKILVNDTDGNDDTLVIQSVTGATGGTAVLNEDGSVTFTPDLNFNGAASFTYVASDGQIVNNLSDTGSVTVNVAAVNDAPDVTALTPADLDEDDAAAVYDLLAGQSDVDTGDVLTVNGVVAASSNSERLVAVSLDGSDLTLDPGQFNDLAEGESETVTVTYNVNDGTVDVANTLTVVVTGSNDAPVVTALEPADLDEDDAAAVYDLLAGQSDPDATDELSVNSPVAVSTNAGRTVAVSLDGSDLTLDPGQFNDLAEGESETVTVTYNVNDGTADVANTLTVVVTGSNDAPVVTALEPADLDEDDAAAVYDLLAGQSDPDATDELSVNSPVAVSTNAGRTVAVSLDGFDLTLDPGQFNDLAEGESETVTVTYNVNDGTVDVENTLTVVVTGSNDAPVISIADTVTHSESVDDNLDVSNRVFTALDPAATATDVDITDFGGGTLTAAVAGGLATDQLDFVAGTGVTVDEETGAVSVGETVIGTLTGRNTDTVTVTFNAAASLANVQTLLQALGYATSEDNPMGAGLTRTIDITLVDGDGAASNTETVTVTITPQNDSPTPLDDIVAVNEGSSRTFQALLGAPGDPSDDDSDPENDPLTVVSITDIIDGEGGGMPASSPVDVSPGLITTDLGAVVTISQNGSVQYDVTSPTAAFNALKDGATATDTFEYEVSDGNGGFNQATVTVTITGVNDAITAASDTIAITEVDDQADLVTNGTAGVANLLTNDQDVDFGDTKSVIEVVGGSGVAGVQNTLTGFTLTLVSGVQIALAFDGTYSVSNIDAAPLTETPVTASFNYTVQDGGGSQSTTAVSISLTGENDAPVVTALEPADLDEDDAAAVYDLLAGQSDPDATDELSVNSPVAVSTNAGRTVAVSLDGSDLTLDPGQFNDLAEGESETVTVTYNVNDGTVDVANTLTVVVTGSNDAPVVTALEPADLDEDDAAAVYDLLAGQSDPDATDELSVNGVVAASSNSERLVAVSLEGSDLTLDPGQFNDLAEGESETVTVTYNVNDGTVDVANTLTVVVTGSNDAPVVTALEPADLDEDDAAAVYDLLAGQSDPDATDELSVNSPVAVSTNAGRTVAVSLDGSDLTLDPGQFNDLAEGESETVTVTYNVNDGTVDVANTLTVVVTGSNDAPVVTALEPADLDEDDAAAVYDLLAGQSDPDATDELSVNSPVAVSTNAGRTVAVSLDGSDLTLDPGQFNDLAEGESETVTVTYNVNDGTADVANTLTVVVTGSNDAPVVTALEPADLDEDDAAAVYDLLAGQSDPDATDELSVNGVVAASSNSERLVAVSLEGSDLTLDPGQFNDLAEGESETVTVTYNVNDGTADVVNTLTVVVTGSNDAPVVTALEPADLDEDDAAAVYDLLAGQSDPDATDELSVNGVVAASSNSERLVAVSLEGSDLTLDPGQFNDLAEGESETVTVTYNVNDGTVDVANTLTVVVTGSNDAPVVTALEPADLDEDDAAAVYDLLAGQSDPDATDELSVNSPVAVSTNAGRTVAVSLDGSDLTLDPGQFNDLAEGESETVTVTYNVNDGTADVANTLTVVVTGSNDAPVVTALEPADLDEDDAAAVYDLLAGQSDPDATDVLSVNSPVAVSTNAGRTVAVSLDGSDLTLDPGQFNDLAEGESETVTVTYNVNDGTADVVNTLTVVVTGSNDAPVVTALEPADLDEDDAAAAYDLLAGQSDPDATDELSVNSPVAVSTNAGRTVAVSLDGSDLTLDPGQFNDLAEGESETVTVTYNVNDGTVDVANTLTVVVTGSNDAPVVTALEPADLDEDDAAAVYDLLAGQSDPDATDELSVNSPVAVSTNAGRTVAVSLDGSDLTLDPGQFNDLAEGESETVTVTYNVNDGTVDVANTLTVVVTGSNDAPVVTALEPADLDEDDAAAVYDLLAGQSDPDATDELSVNSPVAVSTNAGRTVAVSLEGSDLTLDPGQFNDLAEGESETVTVTYNVNDGTADVVNTLTVVVTGSNDAPVVTALEPADLDEDDAAAAYDLLAGQSDPDATDVLSVNSPVAVSTNAGRTVAVSLDGSDLTLDPGQFNDLAEGESETVTVTYNVNDGTADVANTLTVVVTGSNDAPVVTALEPADLDEDDAAAVYDLLAGQSDPDATDVLSVNSPVAVSTNAGRTVAVSLDGSDLTLDPGQFNDLAEGESETVTVTYNVNDGTADVANTLTVVVTGSNDAPVVTALEPADLDEDDAAAVYDLLAGQSDPDATDVLSVNSPVAVSTNAGRTVAVSLDGSDLTLDPGQFNDLAEGESETVTVTYNVNDGTVDVANTLTVVVTGSNDAPVVTALEPADLDEDDAAAVYDLLAGQSDPDATDVLSVNSPVAVSTNAGRTVAVSLDGSDLTLDPGQFNDLAEGESETVTVTYNVNDGTADVANTLTVVVTGSNDAPVVTALEPADLDEDDAAAVYDLLAGQSDPDATDELSVNGVVAASSNSERLVAVSLEGSDLTLDPGQFNDLAEGESETVTVTYNVNDGTVDVANTLTVVVTGSNDAPVVTALEPADLDEDDAAAVYDLLAGQSDPDATDELSVNGVVAASSNSERLVAVSLEGSDLTLDPGQFNDLAEGESETVTVTYNVNDGTVDVANTLTVVVTGSNDAPVVTALEPADLDEDDAAAVYDLLAGQSDPDATDELSVNSPVAVSTNAGRTVAVSLDGSDLTLDPGQFNDLAEGESETVTVTYNVNDGTADVANTLTVVVTGSNDALIFGTPDADNLVGDNSANLIFGLGSNDTINAFGGNDTVDGDAGDDQVFGGAGNDNLKGDSGADLLNGGIGNDELRGGLDNDTLIGDDGMDTLVGAKGDDSLVGGLGDDRMFGGDDQDFLQGNGGADLIYGGTGNDELRGALGNDTLIGEDGSDTLIGAKGNDSLVGGLGDDQMFGGDDQDFLQGNGGEDEIYGGSGNDEIRGATGDDTLFGEGGNDTIIGARGVDIINGGVGRDVMTGGADSDSFVFNNLSDMGTSVATADVITDFEGGIDNIDLVALEELAFIESNAFSGTSGEVRAVADGANTNIEIDLNGDGTADRYIVLQNFSGTLSDGDFNF